jgi:hypothetical protein
VMMLDQRKHNLARFIGVANGPVAAANVGCAIPDYREQQAEGEYQKRKGSTQSHKRSPLQMSLNVGG